MPKYTLTDDNRRCITRADGAFHLKAHRDSDALVHADTARLHTPDGRTHVFKGGAVAFDWSPVAFTHAEIAIEKVGRRRWPDLLHNHAGPYPLLLSRRAADALIDAEVGRFFIVPADLTFERPLPKRVKQPPEYVALFPAPAGAHGGPLHASDHPFHLMQTVLPPEHAPGDNDLFAVANADRTASYRIIARRNILEIARRDQWLGAAFIPLNIPALRPDEFIDPRTDHWPPEARPPLPDELTDDDVIQRMARFARLNFEGRGMGGLPTEIRAAVIERSHTLIPRVAKMLRDEGDPDLNRAARFIISNAFQLAKQGWLDVAPTENDRQLAYDLAVSEMDG